jgi:lipopolysaccharide export system protein LptA
MKTALKSVLRVLLKTAGMLLMMGACLWTVRIIQQQDPFARFSHDFAQSGLGDVGVRLENVEILFRHDEKPIAQFSAHRVDLHRTRDFWWVYQVRDAKLYQEGKLFAKATADYLEYRSIRQEVYVSGNPQITLLNNRWLKDKPIRATVSAMLWNLKKRTLQSEGAVQLRWQGGQAETESLSMNLSNRSVELGAGFIRLTAGSIPARLSTFLPLGSQSATQNNQKQQRELKITWKGRARSQDDVLKVSELQVLDGDTEMRAKSAELDNEQQHVIATGDLQLRDPRAELTGDKLEAWLDQKRAMLTGSVRLLVKPKLSEEQKPAGEKKTETGAQPPEEEEKFTLENIKKYPVMITCDQIEYFYRKKTATLNGNLKATQTLKNGKIRTLTAEKADYDQKKEILTLTGNVVIEFEKGKLLTPKVVVSVKEGDEWFEADPGSGIITVDEEEETEPRR